MCALSLARCGAGAGDGDGDGAGAGGSMAPRRRLFLRGWRGRRRAVADGQQPAEAQRSR